MIEEGVGWVWWGGGYNECAELHRLDDADHLEKTQRLDHLQKLSQTS